MLDFDPNTRQTDTALAASGLAQAALPATARDMLGSGWRPVSARVSMTEQIPGPQSEPLRKISGMQNAFARIEGATPARLVPGEQASFNLIVAQPSAVSSALVFGSQQGQAELRIRWTSSPPTYRLIGKANDLRPTWGSVQPLGLDTFALGLAVENTTDAEIDVTPALYVTRGIENAGLDAGLFAGAVRIERETSDTFGLMASPHFEKA